MEIIGLSGKMASGKTTMANVLVESKGFVKLSFATMVKKVTEALYLEITGEDKIPSKDKMRVWYQSLGNTLRDYISDDVWIQMLEMEIEQCPKDANIVIDDVRYVNEAVMLRRLGGVLVRIDVPEDEDRVRVISSLYPLTPVNSLFVVSETDMDDYLFKYKFYNHYREDDKDAFLDLYDEVRHKKVLDGDWL